MSTNVAVRSDYGKLTSEVRCCSAGLFNSREKTASKSKKITHLDYLDRTRDQTSSVPPLSHATMESLALVTMEGKFWFLDPERTTSFQRDHRSNCGEHLKCNGTRDVQASVPNRT